MTIQLNFDKPNQQRLLKMVEWLKDVGIIKSYKFPSELAESEAGNVEVYIKKDTTGILQNIPREDLNKMLGQAQEQVTQFDNENITVALAALLYDAEIFSAGQAADFSGLSKADFIRQVGKYKVSIFGESAEDIHAL